MPPQGHRSELLGYGSDEDRRLPSSPAKTIDPLGIVRRVTPTKGDPSDSTRWWETASSSSASPPRNPEAGTRKHRQKIRNRRNQVSYRMVTATFCLVATVGILYYGGLSWTFDVPSRARSSFATDRRLKEPAKLLTSGLEPLGGGLDNSGLFVEQSETLENIIHIVHTRFMQNQPDLIELGLARLELFREFALRSLQEQSSPNFLWVIRTDPSLHPTLQEPLLDLLRGIDNHLLVATNENPNVQIHSILSVDPKDIWSGHLSAAQTYLQPPSTKPKKVLESRLDSDDALHYQFIEYIQIHAMWDLPEEDAQWKLWCASQHFEWQFHTATDSIDPSSGLLISIKDNGCISAGLTLGYTEGLTVHDLPPIKHQNLGHALPSCQNQDLRCLDFINLLPTALRARTPTSAGMMNVLLGRNQKVNKRYYRGAIQQETLQHQMWTMVVPRFGFAQEQASQLRTYLTTHLAGIAKDNLKGQCSDGHSCKDVSKVVLQAIIDDPSAFA